MITEVRGAIDYAEAGSGPTIVLVPGSCSTGAAWRPVISQWQGRFRCVTTSLLGYGGTVERRIPDDADIAYEAEILEAVIRRAAAPVHLVGHSFGGLAALAVALRRRVPLLSLVLVEPPAPELLRHAGEHDHYRAFRDMTAAYFAAFRGGDEAAIASMIDFYGGAGSYAAWPERVRRYAVATTPANILDWASAYGFPLTRSVLATVAVPTLVMCGGASHPAMQCTSKLLAEWIPDAAPASIAGASHFLIATHADQVAREIAAHVGSTADGSRRSRDHEAQRRWLIAEDTIVSCA